MPNPDDTSAPRWRVKALLDTYDTPLGVTFLVGMVVLWVVLSTEQEATYPKLHARGLHSWAVTCAGAGRTYRLHSANTSGSRSGASLIQRSLSLFSATGDELYYTQRFDPDAYERDGVWAFRVGWDNRLFAPRWRSDEVLYGDEARFEIAGALDALTVVDQEGRRLGLVCQERATPAASASDEGAGDEDQRPQQGREAGDRAGQEDGGQQPPVEGQPRAMPV